MQGTCGNAALFTGVDRVDEWSIGGGRAVESARPRFAAPEDLFEHDYDRLVQALTVIAGSRDVAADAVQEAFVRLINRWEKVAVYEDPAGWVRRVAVNLIRDEQRAFLRQTKLLLKLERDRPAPERLLRVDGELWEQVRSLPLRQRTALALVYVADLTARETADVMRVSEGTVDRHLDRARTRLREALKGAWDESL
jgi:RNA polymerase sigma-70 factor, ECF subfamily